MALEKLDHSYENTTVREFYHALSEFLECTSKDALTVFEQLLDAGLKVSTWHSGYVGDTPIQPGDIKVAIRKAASKGKQGEDKLNTLIEIPDLRSGNNLSSQEVSVFLKEERNLRNKLDLAIKREEDNELAELSRERKRLMQKLNGPFKMNLADMYINRANADEIFNRFGEESCPWPGIDVSEKQQSAESQAKPQTNKDDLFGDFKALDNLTADELALTFTSNNSIKVVARNGEITKIIPFSELGLLNRSTGKLNKQGEALKGLAKKTGEKVLNKDTDPQHVARIRKIFYGCFEITSDPFFPFRKGVGWEAQFSIEDRSDSKDNRAQRKAIHVPYDDSTKEHAYGLEDKHLFPETDSITSENHEGDEHTFDDEDDDAGRWLNNHSN